MISLQPATSLAAPSPPFTECPAIGDDTSCGVLVVVNPDETTTSYVDSNQGPVDGSDDVLVGILNTSASTVTTVPLTGNGIFELDGDGLCVLANAPNGCPFGPTTYEGPNTSFNITDDNTGTVVFASGLAPGASAYFSLEGAASSVSPPPPGAVLGSLDLNGYCRSLGYSNATLSNPQHGPQAAYNNWTCVAAGGSTTPIDLQKACEATYPERPILAQPTDADDAYTWRCYQLAQPPPPQPPPPPPAAAAESCAAGPPAPGPPRDVVILITGLTSELRYSYRYDPLGKSYCGLANASTTSGDLRDLAFMAHETFDHHQGGTISPIDLTDSLAGTGAVLLPFSYDGVSLKQAVGKPPLYQIKKFDSDRPGAANPKDEATGYLLGLIEQIHAVWPHAHIQVIGHSEGGFVAEQLFEWEKYSKLTGLNVTRIFSLDSPINGVALASNDWLNKICATASGASNASCLGIISPGLLQLYAERWENKEANDRALIKRDAGEEHQLYIPIGTQNDWLYKIADVSTTFGDFVTGVCEGLDTQILWNDFSFSCYLEDVQNQGGRRPSFVSDVTPDPSSGVPARPGFALNSHEFVMQSADNIKFITALGPGAYAQSARVSQSFEARAAAYSPVALASSGTSPPGALFEQILTPAPFAVLPNPIARPGLAFKIAGSDLGETPGRVFFSSANGEVSAIIRSWTPEGVEVVIPAEATSGIVRVLTATEDELLPGVVAVVASGPADNVVRILEAGRSRAIDGEGDRIKLRALDRRRRAVAGATVELVGGGLTRRASTDRRGLATFVVDGHGEQQYIAVSGTTTTLFTARWRRAARQTLALTVHRKRGRVGRPASWTIVASIRTAAGRPVAGELVDYELHALPGSKLNRTSARTNRAGIAHVTLSITVGAAALVEVLADHATLTRGVTLRN